MDQRRKRYLMASALLEYIQQESGKPLELRRDNDVEDMESILHAEYADLTEVLMSRKASGHRNLASTFTVVQDED